MLGLTLIPSGPLPPNPADILQTPRFSYLLNRLAEENDFILIDTPPTLAVSDPLSIAGPMA